MAGVYHALRIFALEHRGCGDLRGDAEPITPEGYEVWVRCGCGARLEQWVSPAEPEADLLRSALLAFEYQAPSVKRGPASERLDPARKEYRYGSLTM